MQRSGARSRLLRDGLGEALMHPAAVSCLEGPLSCLQFFPGGFGGGGGMGGMGGMGMFDGMFGDGGGPGIRTFGGMGGPPGMGGPMGGE